MKKTELPIASPCNADWSTMDPRDKARFCGECKKLVHDLSSLRETDAKRLLASRGEGLCVRYLQTRYLAFVCIVSVMLGVATLIVVNAVMSGFSTRLKDRLHGVLSDVVVDTDRADGFALPQHGHHRGFAHPGRYAQGKRITRRW